MMRIEMNFTSLNFRILSNRCQCFSLKNYKKGGREQANGRKAVKEKEEKNEIKNGNG